MITVMDKAREIEWDMWLSSLKPWELHFLRDRELDWHDDFIAGIADFSVFRAVLDAEFPEAA